VHVAPHLGQVNVRLPDEPDEEEDDEDVDDEDEVDDDDVVLLPPLLAAPLLVEEPPVDLSVLAVKLDLFLIIFKKSLSIVGGKLFEVELADDELEKFVCLFFSLLLFVPSSPLPEPFLLFLPPPRLK
jgi:hypothetical protein